MGHAFDFGMHNADGQNQISVVHDGLADPANRTGDPVMGGALAFLDELGRFVHGAQDQVAAGRSKLFATP